MKRVGMAGLAGPRGIVAAVLAMTMAGGVATARPAAAEAAAPAETAAAAARVSPQRIVSLNLCTDQILVDLVARSRIAAVSHLAADPTVSAVAGKAAGLPETRGEAEHVLAFDPDLVLAGAFSTPATVSILERVGRRVVKVGLADDLDGIAGAVRRVGAAVGEEARGEALVADLRRRLAAAAEPGRPASSTPARPAAPATPAATAPTALVYQVNGLTAGAGTLSDAVLAWAGLANHAAGLSLGRGGRVPLEALVASPPDLIVLTGPADEYRTVVAENLRHPALRRVMAEHRSVVVPWRTWLCGTPYVADAVEALAAVRREIERRKAGL